MKKNKTNRSDTIGMVSMLMLWAFFWATIVLEILGIPKISVVLFLFYSISNIIFWICMNRMEGIKEGSWFKGIFISEFIILIPWSIILLIKGLL